MTRHTLPDRPARRLTALVSAALLVLAACSGGDGDQSAEAADRASTTANDDDTGTSTSTTGADADPDAGDAGDATDAGDADDPAGDGSDAPQEPTGDGDGDAVTTTSAAAGDSGGGGDGGTNEAAGEETAAPARPIVPRSGTYTYERTTTTSEGSETETNDSVIERLSGDDTSGRIRQTVESEQGKLTNDATVSDDGTLVERSLIDSPLGEIDCDWEPDWFLHGPMTEGATWTIDTSCQDEGTGFSVEVSITGSGTVVGFEQIDVNGESVTVWVTETSMVTEFTVTSATANGTQRTESDSRTWIHPGLGTRVLEETSSQHSGDFQNGSSEVVSEFQGFTPA